MRLSFHRFALAICATCALTVGCGGAQPPIPAPLASAAQKPMTTAAKLKTDLFVNDNGYDAVEILKSGTWAIVGSITNGISYPEGNWVDKRGNLYVGNVNGNDVTEYDRAGKLKYTYTAGIAYPTNVTTDTQGNVYEADYLYRDVNEYHQGTNTVLASCQLGGEARGVAVDEHGDVFVSYYTGSYGAITEYSGGLSGCSGRVLGATVTFPGGTVLDKNDNLVICDVFNRTVDVIAPPCSQVSGYLGSGYDQPLNVTINKANSRAYVADYANQAVYVISYPAGKTLATLNYSTDGLRAPQSAVDRSNYVP